MESQLISLSVRARDMEGFVDSEWISLTSGIVVLTGRNNVGKTRFLRGAGKLSLLPAQPSLPPQTTRLSSEMGPIPEVRLCFGDISVHIAAAADGRLRTIGVKRDGMWHYQRVMHGSWADAGSNDSLGEPGFLLTQLSTSADFNPPQGLIKDALERLVYIPSVRKITQTRATQATPSLDPDGGNLVNVIEYHASRRTPEFHTICTEMRLLFEEIGEIMTWPESSQVTLRIRDRFSGGDLVLDDVGTGLAQVLHLVTGVVTSPADRIFLIDEPHAFLHPTVERLFVDFLRRNTQHSYVCATHSPVFLNAAQPDQMWLVTRNEAGTQIESVFGKRLPRRQIFEELGIRPGDVAFSQRLICVEGPTEERALPIILRRLGWDQARSDYEVINMGGGDAVRAFTRASVAVVESQNVAFTICLDGDKSQKYTGYRHVRFLPVDEIEDFFLNDPEAIRASLLESLPDDGDMAPGDVAKTWPAARIQTFIDDERRDRPHRKASDILEALARAMGTSYDKPNDGARIAERMRLEPLEQLVPVFEDFLPPRH